MTPRPALRTLNSGAARLDRLFATGADDRVVDLGKRLDVGKSLGTEVEPMASCDSNLIAVAQSAQAEV
jgi:hypothetical protein